MSKFKEKELLEYFDDMCLFLANHHWTKRDERAVTIREMIQKKPEEEEIETRYIEIILDLYDRLEQKKPKVTEEFVERWVGQIFFLPLNAMEHWYVCLPKQLKDMLKEAGVEVVGK